MGWIIAAGVVLLIALLLAGRVSVFFDYNGELALKVKYLCVTVVKIPKKAKAKPKKDKPEKSKKSRNEGEEEGKKKKGGLLKNLTFDDILALLKQALTGIGKPLRKLFKSIVISHLSLNITVGGDDAAKTAIKFGAMNIAVGNVLGLLDSFLTLKPLDDLNIGVDFQSEETLYDAYFEMRMTLFAGLVAVIRLARVAIKLFGSLKKKKKANIAKKRALRAQARAQSNSK
ncbi:MAG: DUF2953 domain-containing protein [Oscillospiraceae bacterium]|nr:DUF2953 domain-containing protein [Oscillospiraceae bacterium]